jgi:Tol biopolymer transport system component
VSDIRELLRPGVEGFEPKRDAFERVLARRDRKRRRQRIAAGIVGAAVFAMVVVLLVRLLSSEPTPAVPQPVSVRNGEWVVVSVSSLDPGARPMSRGRPADLFVTGPDGSGRLLAGTKEGTLERCPAFSPDGTMLAYAETGAGEKSLVVRGFSSAGTFEGPATRIRMLAAKSFVAPCPVWAPDGRRLAAIEPGLGVLIVDLDGTRHLVKLDAYGLVKGGTIELKWSPDGSQLALLAPSRPSNETVWLVPVDGGAARSLAGFGPDTRDIAWTADGRSLLAIGGACCPEGPPFAEVLDVATGDSYEIPLPQTWGGSLPWGAKLHVRSTTHDRWSI